MRALLISLLLIITAVLIYSATAEGNNGMKNGLNRAGGAMEEYIKGMSP